MEYCPNEAITLRGFYFDMIWESFWARKSA
jgi:hypothetical protein